MDRPPVDPPLVEDRLAEIVTLVEEAHEAEPGAGASLVRVRGLVAEEVELALAPVPEGDVLGALLGAVVPAEWEAAGVVVDGTARAWPDGRVGTDRGRARVAVLCHRSGATASVLRRAGEDPVVDRSPRGTSPIGRVADAVRRSLGLATPPPEVGVAVVVVQVWLHRVSALALDGGRVDLDVARSLRPPLPATWAALREQCAGGGWGELDCPPRLAAWMDDGMFARWCVASFPEPIELVVELADLVPLEVGELLARALADAQPRRSE
ncbi:hypothetical protein [Actinomarinicola tropica]|uniref:Uncharacterized protein n=1 Tax=Actinomarinicola tropica TaxID=2789776 RepID=A0A5Q2RLJ8_9ACTN|nr:hypothetical protein [Actinomarinicola tropica]QGG94730.1 hypothetical protein GH723_06185 [Actinomarinicola tropica]